MIEDRIIFANRKHLAGRDRLVPKRQVRQRDAQGVSRIPAARLLANGSGLNEIGEIRRGAVDRRETCDALQMTVGAPEIRKPLRAAVEIDQVEQHRNPRECPWQGLSRAAGDDALRPPATSSCGVWGPRDLLPKRRGSRSTFQ